MKTIKGDLIYLAKDGYFDVIVHGCNCFCTMGAGIALQIKDQFPEALAADKCTVAGDREKLGGITFAKIGGLTVVNAYTQYQPGRNVDFVAIRMAMRIVRQRFPESRIGLPKIGAGIAGGDWESIKQILEEELKDLDVTIVEWDK